MASVNAHSGGSRACLCRRVRHEALDAIDGVVDTSSIHPQVRHKAQANQTRGQNAMGLQILKQGRATSIGHIHKHDVGLRRTHAEAWHALQALGQSMRQRMVVGQALDMVVQRVQSRCRQNA